MANHKFHLTAEFIELDNLIKHLGFANSGGAAKAMVADGWVKVDGVVETRKTRKLRAGQVVVLGPDLIEILPPKA